MRTTKNLLLSPYTSVKSCSVLNYAFSHGACHDISSDRIRYHCARRDFSCGHFALLLCHVASYIRGSVRCHCWYGYLYPSHGSSCRESWTGNWMSIISFWFLGISCEYCSISSFSACRSFSTAWVTHCEWADTATPLYAYLYFCCRISHFYAWSHLYLLHWSDVYFPGSDISHLVPWYRILCRNREEVMVL